MWRVFVQLAWRVVDYRDLTEEESRIVWEQRNQEHIRKWMKNDQLIPWENHCAFMAKEKDYPTLKGFPLGVGGVEHSFSIMYRRFGDEIIDKMSKNTGILQDFPSKGELGVGKDADISIFQEMPDYFEKENHGTCDYSIYDGVIGAGEFKHVLVRGQFVLKDRKIVPHKGKEIICGE